MPPHQASTLHEQQVAVPAPPKQVTQEETSQCPAAVSALPTSEISTEKAKSDPELTRKKRILFNKADRLTMSFANNGKIAYSGCQGDIEDEIWKILKEKPLDFFKQDKLDDDKVYETYKSTARSL